ncbi:hypothetical protein PENSPDRAFT_750036 [Peniophora sp. CONT]|nr:hypothetical protein PENSPDRAFT_750036 [Peniophora sp. CONT]
MPVLVPSFLPPPPASTVLATNKQPVLNEQSSSSSSTLPASGQPQPLAQPISDSATADNDTLEASVPAVTLSQSTIEPELAAALASSMLGHVLFLKGQVPMPAAQLARLPQPLNATKAKKRTELLTALDTLNSHLHTTFQALAEALAQRGQGSGSGVYEEVKGKENVGFENGGVVGKGKDTGNGDVRDEERGEAQVVFAVGPTPGAPKARVVFALRGLALGERKEEEESEEESGEEESEEEEDSEEEESSGEESDRDEQPSSRAPSPPSTQPLDDVPPIPPPAPVPSFTPFTNPSPSVRPPLSNKPLPLSTRPSLSHSHSSLSTFSSSAPPRLNTNRLSAVTHGPNSRAEAQASIRAAERALGKTLAEDGRLAAGGELAPTHTHILLRAPRRFVHPAWRPRAQLGAALDSYVADALGPPNPKKKSAKKPEGVIVCASVDHVVVPSIGEGGKEEDEMIWWLWDGRLTGFADW